MSDDEMIYVLNLTSKMAVIASLWNGITYTPLVKACFQGIMMKSEEVRGHARALALRDYAIHEELLSSNDFV